MEIYDEHAADVQTHAAAGLAAPEMLCLVAIIVALFAAVASWVGPWVTTVLAILAFAVGYLDGSERESKC